MWASNSLRHRGRQAVVSSSSKALQRTSVQRFSSSVRLIAVEDLPHGKAYKGDVVSVKPGYARNYLIPNKKAVYATPQNFEKMGIIDPHLETEEQRIARLQRESTVDLKAEQYLKEADTLKTYLRNKVLKIWRVVDPNSVGALHPGVVTAGNLRQKLSHQLKIDLQPHETIHIVHPVNTGTSSSPTTLSHSELDNVKVQKMVDEFVPAGDKCEIQLKRVGEYVAKITLEGGHFVPLRFVVQQRLP